MRTGNDDRHPTDMTVLADRDETGRWQPLVAAVGRLVGLRPSMLALPAAGDGWAAAVMRVAAASPGPVLVLPRREGPGAGEPARPSRLERAVIASDDTWDVVHAARLCALHLLRSGVETTVLVVLTRETAPPMWEGTGHHAAAWRTELGRRHGRPDRLDVVPGPAGPTVRARTTDTDLVVLLWHRNVAEGRAAVLRDVLDEDVVAPSLLVPLDWVERAWSWGPALAGTP
jgi:hypothetical protein